VVLLFDRSIPIVFRHPPRRVRDREKNRSVTFLELFHDPVYVVLISEIAHTLSKQIDLAHIGGLVILCMVVWWVWLNGSIYYGDYELS